MRKFHHFLVAIPLLIFATGVQAEKLNINTASAEQLARIMKGVGIKKARAIIRYRKQHGPFTRLEQLLLVKGIGPKTLARNRHRLTLIGLDRLDSLDSPRTTRRQRARRRHNDSPYHIVIGQ